MGVPFFGGGEAARAAAAEALLSDFENLAASERRNHATVYNYWLSIRGKAKFPPIRDLDPLEISDAGPSSVLLELVDGGEDAVIRHLGQAHREGNEIGRISEAGAPSLLACIAARLADVASSEEPVAFEDRFATDAGATRCWVTLLPFNSTSESVDFVYGFITTEPVEAAEAVETVDEEPLELDEGNTVAVEDEAEAEADTQPQAEAEAVAEPQPVPEPEPEIEPEPEPVVEAVEEAVDVEPEPEPTVAVETRDEPKQKKAVEGVLQNKLNDVREKAEEARLAKLRSEAALCEGLSAAYDFALDAEDNADEYLKLVEKRGLKIQLRSPMAPVVKLAFAELADDATIAQLETVFAWALKMDVPRGSLASRIEAEGGIAQIAAGRA